MSQFSPQSLSDVQLQGQPPQSDIQSHPHHLHHQLHPHAQSSNQNINLNPMMNPGPSMPQGPLGAMQDPNLDPKLSGLNEQPKIALANLLPSGVDPKGAALDIRNLNPKDLLHLLKNLPMLQDNNAARRRTNSTSIQPTAGPSTLPNTQSQSQSQAQTAPTSTSPITSPTASQSNKGVKRKRGKMGEDGEEMDAEDWTRQRKDNHKEVERRRRGNINHGINELAKVVPFAGTDRAKSAILHRAVTYIHHLKENEARNIEKWTLEKLLMDQAMADLQQQLEEMRRLWDEERQAKQRALLELDVIRSSGGASVNMQMGGGANVQQQQQQQQQAVAPSNGNHITGGGNASRNSSIVTTTYGPQGMYQTSSEQQQQQQQRPQHPANGDNPDGEQENIVLDDDYSGMSKELETATHEDAEEDMEDNDDADNNDENDEDEGDGDDGGDGDEGGRA